MKLTWSWRRRQDNIWFNKKEFEETLMEVKVLAGSIHPSIKVTSILSNYADKQLPIFDLKVRIGQISTGEYKAIPYQSDK